MKPSLRVAPYSGEWNCVSLEHCLEISDAINKDNEYGINDVYSVSDEFGIVNQIEHLGRSYAGRSLLTYKILRPGQIVYTKSPLRHKPYGVIKAFTEQRPGIVSVLYAVYNAKQGVSSAFIQDYFDYAERINKYLQPLVNKGAKNTINISDANALKGSLFIPETIDEQEDVSFFTKTISSFIHFCEKRITSLTQFKSACLISMFPQDGEMVPRVRFAGFEETWHRCSIGDFFKERLESNPLGEMLSVTINNGIIRACDNGRYDNSNSDKSKYKVVKVGDIAYNTMRMWQGACGYSNYEGIVSPAYTVVAPLNGADSLFFSYLFKTNNLIKEFRLHSQGMTKDTWNLKYPAFSRIECMYPSSIEEQRSIASLFSNLDTEIALLNQHLDKLKQIKAACLDKMFV